MQTEKRRRFPIWLIGIAMLALAALACDDRPYYVGITCLKLQNDGSIFAPDYPGPFVSMDGGLTWAPSRFISVDDCPETFGSVDRQWKLNDRTNPDIVYRFTSGVSIERSTDGGATWHKEVDLSGIEARTAYYKQVRKDGEYHLSGPVDSLIDPKTGNLIVAMVYEGVLVRTPDAQWHWVSVGKYSRVNMWDLNISIPLIFYQLLTAAMFAMVSTSTLRTLFVKHTMLFVVLCISTSLTITAIVGRLTVDSQFPLGLPALLLSPFLIGWAITWLSKRQQSALFVWSAVGWTYYAAAFFGLSAGGFQNILVLPRDGFRPATDPQYILMETTAIMGVMFIYLMANQVVHFRKTTLLLFALCCGSAAGIGGAYYLWAVGWIPFYYLAALTAFGIGTLTLSAAGFIVRRSIASSVQIEQPASTDVPTVNPA